MSNKYHSRCYGCNYYEGVNNRGDIGSIFCSLRSDKEPRNGITGCSSFSPDQSASCYRGCANLIQGTGLDRCSEGLITPGAPVDGYCRSYAKKNYFEEKESKKSGCFLTTAYVEFAGLQDDCEELNLMRKLRDEHVLKIPGGAEMLNNYEKNSPEIIRNIKKLPHKSQVDIYNFIFNKISITSKHIKQNNFSAALSVYSEMYLHLRSESITNQPNSSTKDKTYSSTHI